MTNAFAELQVRHLGIRDYGEIMAAMQHFTANRDTTSPDAIWTVEHPPVFTLGQAGRREHVLDPGQIPVVQSDRGGQVTYHGPGQAVFYTLFDLRRHGLGIRALVSLLENAAIALLADYGIEAVARSDAPGVYVDGRKIASLGIRVRRGCCYHGLSLNVAMDLEPFRRINPCGYAGLEVIQISELVADCDMEKVRTAMLSHLTHALSTKRTASNL
ncbi:MAG: lipoyl(octanoyl) transferase LipB [Gammaproteobacteria bacterium]|nr:lipoyl(octanoyl) transferase LipB [Gammaproteobacteria bacterium]